MRDDEVSIREAADYLKHDPFARHPDVAADDEERAKRAREVGNAGATLEAMLGASRRGKTVKR